MVINDHESRILYISTEQENAKQYVGIEIAPMKNIEMSKANGYDTDKIWYVNGSEAYSVGTLVEGYGKVEGGVSTQSSQTTTTTRLGGWM